MKEHEYKDSNGKFTQKITNVKNKLTFSKSIGEKLTIVRSNISPLDHFFFIIKPTKRLTRYGDMGLDSSKK